MNRRGIVPLIVVIVSIVVIIISVSVIRNSGSSRSSSLYNHQTSSLDDSQTRCWYCGRVIISNGRAIHCKNLYENVYECDYCGKNNVIGK